jgi:hypothetical protein
MALSEVEGLAARGESGAGQNEAQRRQRGRVR